MSAQPSTIEAGWVVVGGGSAGCVIAARLSEDPTQEVPRANTNLPTIAAAERLSDLIRGGPAAARAEDERVAF